jgi:TonB family protein
MRETVLALTVLFSVCAVCAQDAKKPLVRGIVNGYAKELPKPVLTPKEEAACASGQVKVEVQINENGKIISATAVSGDKTLWRSAVAAARHARFGPSRIDAPPIKIWGYLVYNFQPHSRCSTSKEKVIWLCNINAKVVNVPSPKYPAAALAVRAHGKVDVQIEIDENGKVISAKAVSGHPLLRSASETAALNAVFEPVVLSDNRVIRAIGTITYNFLP